MKSIYSVVIVGLLLLLPMSVLAAGTFTPAKPSTFSTGDRYVLLTDLKAGNNRVILVDNDKNVLREITSLNLPYDAKLLPNGHILVSDSNNFKVEEYDWNNTLVWKCSFLTYPYEADRLPNGDTLVALCPNQGDGSVVEVNSAGKKVWEKTGLQGPVDAERLANGNTLIPEGLAGRVIEVDTAGNIVWQLTGLDEPSSAERLANGNTLIAQDGNGIVIEVDTNGSIVWQNAGYDMLISAHRLPNGDTFISDATGGVFEVTPDGDTVWSWELPAIEPWNAYMFFSSPPNTPTITGPAKGKIKVPTSYDLSATDPDGDNVLFYVDWGDGKTEWKGASASGAVLTASHTWSEKGDYTIRVKAADIYGSETDWATLPVTMPYVPPFISFLQYLCYRFPNAFPLLRLYLERWS